MRIRNVCVCMCVRVFVGVRVCMRTAWVYVFSFQEAEYRALFVPHKNSVHAICIHESLFAWRPLDIAPFENAAYTTVSNFRSLLNRRMDSSCRLYCIFCLKPLKYDYIRAISDWESLRTYSAGQYLAWCDDVEKIAILFDRNNCLHSEQLTYGTSI